MPYSNLPQAQWARMDRCVESVMQDGTPKGRAIAICHAKIVKGSEMAKKKKERKHIETEALTYFPPFGNAQSWDELQKFFDLQDEQLEIETQTYSFRALMDNILSDASLPIETKSQKLSNVVSGFEMRLKKEKEANKPSLLQEFIHRIKPPSLPVEDQLSKTGFMLFKAADGTPRWFGWVTNRWKDRDGEIITDAAHKEFLQWVEENPTRRMPPLWAWHTKNTQHAYRPDWIDYSNGFLIMSGKLTEKEAKAIQRVSRDHELGMSHGFLPVQRNKEDSNLIEMYRSFEASFLPIGNAANQWTSFDTVRKEEASMDATKREFLSKLAGEEFVAEVEKTVEATEAVLDANGVETKEETQPQDEEMEVLVKAIADKVSEVIGFEELSAFLEEKAKVIEEQGALLSEMKEKIEALTKDKDEEISELMTPRVMPIWKRRASESEETLVDEKKDKDILEDEPGLENHWFADAHAGLSPR